ncbi:MAG TPA: O-antigen ligase family protein [Trinickia sp.]|nr:O-antigen ligase family protein [Trinickia sp.]
MLFNPGNVLAALFILTYPAATLVVHGGASALLIAATLISLGALAVPGALPRMPQTGDSDRVVIATCFALASPLVATLLSELWHGKLVMSLLDSPSRFIAAVPIMFALRRLSVRTLMWSDLSFAIGAIASLVVLKIAAREAEGRMASSFLDAIHFGDIALVLGALSALSLNWWRKDHTAVRVVKLIGLLAGLYASVLTGSRGGWLAIPFVAVIIVYVRGREKSGTWRLLIPLAVLVGMAGVCMSSSYVRERIFLVWSDVVQYSHGHKDTSTGVRLQLYEAAFVLMQNHLVFGLGPNGFANSMQALADAGRLTPMAAALGRGETHNQMLAYAANYGIVGAIAGIALHLMPCVLFARYLKASAAPMRRAALLGLTFVVSFWIFGLSVETFDLKMVASFYAAVIAILGGIAASPAALVPQCATPSSISGAQSQCSAS